MQQKAHKTIGHVTPQRPMTDEEKQARIMQFLQQKREQFSLTILNGLCHNLKDNTPVEIDKDVVDIAVLMADKLMEKLYPINEEKKDDSHRD